MQHISCYASCVYNDISSVGIVCLHVSVEQITRNNRMMMTDDDDDRPTLYCITTSFTRATLC